MSRALKIFAVAALVLLVSLPSVAQDKMWAGAGVDVMIPLGSFADAAGVGFGGTGRFQYNFRPEVAGGVEIGYIVWSGKTVEGVDLPSFKGLPLRVFGKYYFMPSPKALRVYGKVAIGLFFGSVGEKTYNFGGFTYTSPGGSSTDFSFAPEVGVELPITKDGRTQFDGSVRYDFIGTSGGSSGSIGFRAGVNFALGS
jgi:hypothetical protein